MAPTSTRLDSRASPLHRVRPKDHPRSFMFGFRWYCCHGECAYESVREERKVVAVARIWRFWSRPLRRYQRVNYLRSANFVNESSVKVVLVRFVWTGILRGSDETTWLGWIRDRWLAPRDRKDPECDRVMVHSRPQPEVQSKALVSSVDRKTYEDNFLPSKPPAGVDPRTHRAPVLELAELTRRKGNFGGTTGGVDLGSSQTTGSLQTQSRFTSRAEGGS